MRPTKLTKDQLSLLPSALRVAIVGYNAEAAKAAKKGEMMAANIGHRDCIALHDMAKLFEEAKEVEVR